MGQWAGAVREMPVPVPKQSNAGTDQNAVRSTTKWATSLRLEPSGRKDPYGAPVSANCSAEMRSGSEEGSYLRLIDFRITQL